MAKKSCPLNFIYLIGMVLIIVGFCVPLFFTQNPFTGKISASDINGFDFINFDRDSTFSTGALLIFLGGCLGAFFALLFAFVKKSGALTIIKFICFAISIAGAVIVAIKFNDNWITKKIGEGFWKHAFVGTYMLIAGWVVSLIGCFVRK